MGNPKSDNPAWMEDLDSYEDLLDETFMDNLLALGTYVGPVPHTFHVTIEYFETSPEARSENSPSQHWQFEISAIDEDVAKRQALKEFRLIESLRARRWPREVTHITATRTDGTTEAVPAEQS